LKLIVFEHATPLGSAPAHKLFDTVKVTRNGSDRPPRSFDDYQVTLPTRDELKAQGIEAVTVTERI